MYKKLMEFKDTFNTVSKTLLVAGILGIIVMNIGAGKSIAFSCKYFALDVGTCFSWITFLVSDIAVRRYGVKHAIRLSIICLAANIVVCVAFWGISIIPGYWSASYDYVGQINDGINATFASNWYITFISSVAFVASAAVNAVINGRISNKMHNTAFGFVTSMWVSTIVSQIIDNTIFTFLVSYLIFKWSVIQCVVCIFIQVLVEWAFESVFTVFAYKICTHNAHEESDDIEK